MLSILRIFAAGMYSLLTHLWEERAAKGAVMLTAGGSGKLGGKEAVVGSAIYGNEA